MALTFVVNATCIPIVLSQGTKLNFQLLAGSSGKEAVRAFRTTSVGAELTYVRAIVHEAIAVSPSHTSFAVSLYTDRQKVVGR